jgi:hypothetical protein
MRRVLFICGVAIIVASCAPPPPPVDYEAIRRQRADVFQSAAYLIDLRVDDHGRKFSVTTEVYFSGDSVGFYGRGYLGKGAFRGHIIDDTVTMYFAGENEYYSAPMAQIGADAGCAAPGEVLLFALSLLSGSERAITGGGAIHSDPGEISFADGRYQRRISLDASGFPESETLVDPDCGDSIAIRYDGNNRRFPFYKVQEATYINENADFRARGFVREQKYNIPIGPKKFVVVIPTTARRLESIE